MNASVLISMSFVCKIEAVFAIGLVRWNYAINEKDRVIYVMVFTELREN